MECGWTEAVAEDLQALARLAALAPITPAEEEEFQQHVDQTEGETDDWVDDETLPLFGSQWEALVPAPLVTRDPAAALGGCLASWPGLKAKVIGFLRTWPANAPLLTS